MKKESPNTANANATNAEVKEEKVVSAYAINAMRDAIINHHTSGKNRPITKDEAVKAGTTEERWNQWTIWVENLRVAACEFADIFDKKSVDESSKEYKSAEGGLWRAWRSILRVGEEDLFHKNMFVRKGDAMIIMTFAGFSQTVSTSKGRVYVRTGKNEFRKKVEVFLGCRIAGNKRLSDTDRDTVMEYQALGHTIDRLKTLLNGSKTVDGLHTQKANLEKLVETTKTALAQIAPDADLDELDVIKNLKSQVKTLDDDIAKAKKDLEKAEKDREALKPAYEEIEETLDEIERPATKPTSEEETKATLEEVKKLASNK